MKRFFTERADIPETKLTGEENRHLSEVLRAKTGERIILCTGNGKDYVYEITAFDRNSTTLKYVSESENETETKVFLTAYFSMIKGDRSELVCQKLTELGVKKICPFISEYTVARPEKSDRLKRAAHEAAKQCGRAVIPEISDIMSFGEMVSSLGGYDSVLFAYENVNGKSLSVRNALKGNEKKVAIIVGPEGGFSEKEAESLSGREGVTQVTLGKRILRAETASVALAAVVLQLEGEWEC